MDPFPIVAVACDAGDPEATSELLSALPAECGAAIIIVQHFDAGRDKSLATTLAKRTNLRVTPVHDGAEPELNHVYLAPADATLTVSGGRIRVTQKASGLHHPGDILFASLAQERGAAAVGVVLSGTGSDGACGVRAINQSGGTTFAQHPGSARLPSMPISAVETGCVGFVLRPYEIARELVRLGRPTDASGGLARRLLVIDDKIRRPMVVNAATDGERAAP
jgi:two-component system, chemotaxis family, CheB/CheR fusion protein